jgi:hypothetical protein
MDHRSAHTVDPIIPHYDGFRGVQFPTLTPHLTMMTQTLTKSFRRCGTLPHLRHSAGPVRCAHRGGLDGRRATEATVECFTIPTTVFFTMTTIAAYLGRTFRTWATVIEKQHSSSQYKYFSYLFTFPSNYGYAFRFCAVVSFDLVGLTRSKRSACLCTQGSRDYMSSIPFVCIIVTQIQIVRNVQTVFHVYTSNVVLLLSVCPTRQLIRYPVHALTHQPVVRQQVLYKSTWYRQLRPNISNAILSLTVSDVKYLRQEHQNYEHHLHVSLTINIDSNTAITFSL